jgi:hypothetical protein
VPLDRLFLDIYFGILYLIFPMDMQCAKKISSQILMSLENVLRDIESMKENLQNIQDIQEIKLTKE